MARPHVPVRTRHRRQDERRGPFGGDGCESDCRKPAEGDTAHDRTVDARAVEDPRNLPGVIVNAECRIERRVAPAFTAQRKRQRAKRRGESIDRRAQIVRLTLDAGNQHERRAFADLDK
jgi:hypothetical protein